MPREQKFNLRQRAAIRSISLVAALAIRLIGPTLRLEFSAEDGDVARFPVIPAVYAFWHQCVFAAAYIYRRRHIAVMTSLSFDGEYIARTIELLGFRAVRGSSSRGAVGALLGMDSALRAGNAVAFTSDGPRGPRFVARPGPVLLSKTSRLPLFAFHIAVQSKWQLGSWDQTVIPKPFSRVHVRFSRPITVPADADAPTLEAAHRELQLALERVQSWSEAATRDEVRDGKIGVKG